MAEKPYAAASVTFTYLNREDQSEEKVAWNYPVTRVELIDRFANKVRFFEATEEGDWEEVGD